MMDDISECCVACLNDNKNNFVENYDKNLLEEFLNEKLPHVFIDFPVVICNNCSFQLEKFRNFKQTVKNSISTLSKQLNKIYGCRVFIQPLEMVVVSGDIKEEKSNDTELEQSDAESIEEEISRDAAFDDSQELPEEIINSTKDECHDSQSLIKSENAVDLDDDSCSDQWDTNFSEFPNESHQSSTKIGKNEVEYSVEVVRGITKVTTKSKGKTTKWHQYIKKFGKKLPSRKIESEKRSCKKLDTDCSACGIKKLTSYRKHVLSQHSYEENGKPFCSDCNEECTSQQQLVYHFDIHRIFNPPKKCNECPDRLNNMKEYKRHIEAHRFSEKDYKCPDCDMAYRRVGSLEWHYLIIHTGALMCRFCRLVFELKEDYDRHIKAENAARRERKQLIKFTRIRLAREKEKKEKLEKGIKIEENEHDNDEAQLNDLPMVFSRYITNVNGRKSNKSYLPKLKNMNLRIWCHICGIYTSKYGSHVTETHATKLDTGGFLCKICNSTLNVNFPVHFSQVHREFPSIQKCDQCNFTSLRFEPMRKHQLTHKKGLFECHYCGSTYTFKTSVRHHMFLKHSDCSICVYCNKIFEEKSDFKAHMAEEKEKRKKQSRICDICGFTTMNAPYMKRHIARVHARKVTDAVICSTCGKKCKSLLNLNDHMLNVHAEKNVVCNVCGKRFRNRAYMNEHIKMSHTANISTCSMCDKEGNPTQLKRHMYMVHNSERPWVCKICKMSFKIKAGLQKHLHTHAGTRPFNCHLCSQGFYNREVIEKHFVDTHHLNFTREEIRKICKRMPSKYEEEHLGGSNENDD